ncbi:MAG: hypothetical protein ACOC35_09470 [Promethearchaeia archaeon]
MTIRILRSVKDSDLYYYAKEIEINNKRFKTPFSVLHHSVPTSDISQLHYSKMYEIWKTLNISDLENVLSNSDLGREIAKKIAERDNANTKNRPKTYFLNLKGFEGNPLKFFNDQLIEFLINAVFLHTDILLFPIIRKLHSYINTSSMKDQLIEFIEKCYEIATTLNNKPIMAVIHPFAIKYIKPIIRKYLELGVKLFCFNFEGSGLSGYYPNYFQVLREIYRYDKKTYDDNVKYIINLRQPTNRNRYQPFPAEDMITPALSMDILGINHIAGGRRPIKTKKKKKRKKGKKKKRKITNTNLLDTESYNYQRISSMRKFNSVFSDPIIQPNFPNFVNTNYTKRNEFRRRFNYLNQNVEFQRLHREIIANSPISNELQKKSGVQSDLFSKSSILDTFLHNRSISYYFR